MFCAYTRPRYQVSVYMTIDPLVQVMLSILIYQHVLRILTVLNSANHCHHFTNLKTRII